jgi:Tfp pilus assembly protein PilO
LSNLSKREKFLLVSAILLIVVYLYYKFYLVSALMKVDELNRSINKHALLNSQNIESKNYNLDIRNLERKYQIAIHAIPEYEKNPDIAINIKSMAEKSNIVLEDIIIEEPYLLKHGQESRESLRPDSLLRGSNLSVVPVKVIIKGDIQNITNFLSLTEKDDRIAVINNVDINNDEQNSFHAIISINYYYGDKGEV